MGPIFILRWGRRSDNSLNSSLKKIFSSPGVKGFLGFLIISLTPYKSLIGDLIWIPSKVILLISLSVVGMYISSLNIKLFKRENLLLITRELTLPITIKLIIMPICTLLFSIIFGFNFESTKALVIQSAGPTAISVLIINESQRLESKLIGNLVITTTILSFITVISFVYFLDFLYLKN